MLVITSIVLLLIFLQDFKNRSVVILLFPLLFICCGVLNSEQFTVENLIYSILFILFLLSTLTIYLSIKEKKWIAVWNGYFSAGDILFILAITPLFHWMHFVYFFTLGTILVLIIHLLISRFFKDKTVPYAGYLSLITLIFILRPSYFHHFFEQISGNQ